MLGHIVIQAKHRGMRRLSLETGAMAYFEPARRLCWSFGFTPCPPFDACAEDPTTAFMTTALA